MSQCYKQTAAQGRSTKLSSTHRGANLILSQHIQKLKDQEESSRSDVVRVSVEEEESDIITEDGSSRYHAVLWAQLTNPAVRELNAEGPWRSKKKEAVKDSEALSKAFAVEGESGVKRVALRLERKTWTPKELACDDQTALDGLIGRVEGLKQEKLIPPGEGWTRATDNMLWDPRSEVYFVQDGERMGQYLMKDKKSQEFQEVDPPHKGIEFPIVARAAGANAIRRGAKLERTVLLNDLPKISRLALKFPLSFVDSPAGAFALFQGIRTVEAADWCAKNFHTKLIPLLATKIHNWETKELQSALKQVLQDLDAELLRSAHSYSGCAAVVALLLGQRLVVAGVGQARAVLLHDGGVVRPLLACTGDLLEVAERERVEGAGGVVRDGLVHSCAEGADEASRILAARSAFGVLQLEVPDETDERRVKAAYRRLALRVHPDKLPDGADVEAFNGAFTRLEAAKEAVEAMLAEDAEACRELHRVLRAEVHTREGAAELLGVDKAATMDTEAVSEEAERSAKQQIKRLAKMEKFAGEYARGVATCEEAVETLRRACTAEALPRHEALLRVGVATGRAMGLRDLRMPSAIVKMEPEASCWHVPTDKECRLAMLCGATAGLTDATLMSTSSGLRRQPRAAALRWCLDAETSAPSVGAACVRFEAKRVKAEEAGSAAKRQKVAGQAGAIMLRHILFRHPQLKTADPFARRDSSARTAGEAEVRALRALEQLQATSNPPAAQMLFLKLCRELSDCQTADQPGQLTGNMGWVSRGEQEAAFEDAAFVLEPNELSDLVVTSRGIHVIQRLG